MRKAYPAGPVQGLGLPNCAATRPNGYRRAATPSTQQSSVAVNNLCSCGAQSHQGCFAAFRIGPY